MTRSNGRWMVGTWNNTADLKASRCLVFVLWPATAIHRQSRRRRRGFRNKFIQWWCIAYDLYCCCCCWVALCNLHSRSALCVVRVIVSAALITAKRRLGGWWWRSWRWKWGVFRKSLMASTRQFKVTPIKWCGVVYQWACKLQLIWDVPLLIVVVSSCGGGGGVGVA